jgi:quercetin dioxygenase-like cupin family protein
MVVSEDRRGHIGVVTNPEETAMEKTSLTALARQQLATAMDSSSGRSARTVYGGHQRVLRQTVIAMRAGESLAEHLNPGEATVYVLQGRVLLSAGETSWSGWVGDLVIVPEAPHALEALEDSVILMTVAKVR